MSTNREELSKYLNDIKSKVNKDIYCVNEELKMVECNIDISKKEIERSNQETIDLQKKINEVDSKLKGTNSNCESYQNLQSQKLIMGQKTLFNDCFIDDQGDEKTSLEKKKLDYTNFKLKCNVLIETIDMYLEFPDDVENQKKEIQGEVNELFKQFQSFDLKSNIFMGHKIESSLKDLVSTEK